MNFSSEVIEHLKTLSREKVALLLGIIDNKLVQVDLDIIEWGLDLREWKERNAEVPAAHQRG